jgi:hypothetical protein
MMLQDVTEYLIAASTLHAIRAENIFRKPRIMQYPRIAEYVTTCCMNPQGVTESNQYTNPEESRF